MCVCVCVCVYPGSNNYSILAVFKEEINDPLGAHDLFKGSTESNPFMTNLDSILKIRDITLLTKVITVKATVFPVVMYGCELDHTED